MWNSIFIALKLSCFLLLITQISCKNQPPNQTKELTQELKENEQNVKTAKLSPLLLEKIEKGEISLTDTSINPLIKNLISRPITEQDSLLKQGERFRKIKSHWDNELQGKNWRFIGDWKKNPSIEILSSPQKLIFIEGNSIIKEIPVRELIPFETNILPKLSSIIKPDKDNISLAQIKSLIGDLKITNNSPSETDSIILKEREFICEYGANSRGGKVMVTFSITEYPNYHVDHNDTINWNKTQYHAIYSSNGEKLLERKKNLSYKNGNGSLSHNGRFFIVKENDGIYLYDFETETTSHLVYSDKKAIRDNLIWFSNSKFCYSDVDQNGLNIKSLYDVKSDTHFKLTIDLKDNRMTTFDGQKEDGWYPLEGGKPILYEKTNDNLISKQKQTNHE